MSGRLRLKWALPIGVLVLAALGAGVLVATSSPVARSQRERAVRAVRVISVHVGTANLVVESQGTVAPRTESELIPEVSGRVIWTSPTLVSGGYFEAGESLLKIDRSDYEVGAARARAALERARGERRHARQTLARQKDLATRKIVSDAKLDDARRSAEVNAAGFREAELALKQAERDLERTEIVAPFSGRVRVERVDVGQFIARGQSIATLYATDYVEVRLPITDSQLAHLEIDIWGRAPLSEETLPEVVLEARFAGRDYRWTGRVVRTEGEIDAKSRLVHVVARVSNADTDAPLPVGLFVKARIAGRAAEGIARIPRSALQTPAEVYIVDIENRLRAREVEVLRVEGDSALVSRGLTDGDRVCVSQVPAFVDGMVVEPVSQRLPLTATPGRESGA